MHRVTLCIIALVVASAPLSHTQTRADDARLPDALYPDIVAIGQAGRPAEALAALERRVGGTDGDTPIEAQLLRASLLSKAGAYDQSADLWESIAARTTGLESLAAREAADALLQSGRRERAEALLTARPAREVGDQLVRLAAAYRNDDRSAHAITLYRRVIDSSPSATVADQAALGLAAALEASGDREDALAQLVGLQRNFRESATFAIARREAVRLATAMGRRPVALTDAEYRALVGRLLDRSLFADAISVLEEWKAAFPASARRADARLVDALYRARMNAEARDRALAFLERYPDDSLAADVRVLVFRLDVREGRTADVRLRGEALWSRTVPGISTTERLELGRLLAAYLVSVGEVDDGLAVYRRVYQAATTADFQTDIMWRVSVAAIRAGQLARAEANLRALGRRRVDREVSLLVEYWTAALAERQGRPDEAIRAFTALAGREPYHYYGIRARERLTALRAPVPSPEIRLTFPDTPVRESSRAAAEFRAAVLLAHAGLAGEAARLASELAAARRDDRALALLAARAAADAGDFRQSVRLIETRFLSFVQQPARGVPEDFMTLAYPRAFWDDVRRAASALDVDPRLLLSLARQESRFDPGVRSIAGAIGLFQIMPYTADALAPRVGIDVRDRTALFVPEASARLAARLTADLMRLFDGSETAVIAAYNAGDERGAVWWRAADGARDDLFVDTIPYSETRNYVRLVYANYHRYRELYGLD